MQPDISPDPELTAEQAFHEVFWPQYPRKIGKLEALRAWQKIGLKNDDQPTLDHIMRGLEHYLHHEWELDRPRYIPHPSTWLNQRRWLDVD